MPDPADLSSFEAVPAYRIEVDHAPDAASVHRDNSPVSPCVLGPAAGQRPAAASNPPANQSPPQPAKTSPDPCADPVHKKKVDTLLAKLERDGAALELVGMPASHMAAFKDAANEMKCVISSREIGFHCTSLVAEGYDTKGFRIKSKSCDFGPMAGFLLANPLYNKKGASYYFSQKKDVEKALHDLDHVGWRSTLGQICVSTARINWLMANTKRLKISMEYIPSANCYTGTFTPPGSFTVIYVFRQETRNADLVWALYELGSQHRETLMAEQYELHKAEDKLKEEREDASIARLFGESDEDALRAREQAHALATARLVETHKASALSQYERDEMNLNLFFCGELSWDELHAMPLMGLTNPEISYPEGHYKNCVTGDYDLFGVWPKKGAYEPNGLDRRMAGEHHNKEKLDQRIIAREDPRLGNLSERVAIAGATINSNLPLAQFAKGKTRQMVHHSDEAGRPFVSEIELPVIAFMPHCGQVHTVGMKSVEQMRDFFTLCDLMDYYPYRNPGWAHDLRS